MKYVCIGLSITSSWANGQAATYRALLRELAALGNQVLFLEKDEPRFAENRDLFEPSFCTVGLYNDVTHLKNTYTRQISEADVVIVGSNLQQGAEVGNWVISTATGVKAFYDLETPITIAKLKRGDFDYMDPILISKYDIYLSFTGGPILDFIENYFGAAAARPLYCSVDTDLYFPESQIKKWDLGYMGTYCLDRQPAVEELLCQTALKSDRKFVVAGSNYPKEIKWPSNVEKFEHLPPAIHRLFYNSQSFTLNVTRPDMIAAGYSPSVRLFEAAACGVPVISDYWEGLTTIFASEKEILIAKTAADVDYYLNNTNSAERNDIGQNARKRVLENHTSKARAMQLQQYVDEINKMKKAHARKKARRKPVLKY